MSSKRIPQHNRPDGTWCRFSSCDSTTGRCPDCEGITVAYNSGTYRVHKTGCADITKQHHARTDVYPVGTTILEIARREWADFVDDYEDDQDLADSFSVDCQILPCVSKLLG
jgi:hypothetical protein